MKTKIRPRELELVALRRDLPEFGLRAGQIGTVVLVHRLNALEVEFMDSEGDSVALLTILDRDVRVAKRDELAGDAWPDPLPPGTEWRVGDATRQPLPR
ncbi:MAG TPA: DUF4926 domain-containing protein [Dehalococcoidia bacterium]